VAGSTEIHGNSTVAQVYKFRARQTGYQKSLIIESKFWLSYHY